MTAGTARTAVQAAIFAVLSSTVPADDLTALCAGRVYEKVPRTDSTDPRLPVTFPYVVVHDGDTQDASTSSTNDVLHTITVDCWSKVMGDSEIGRVLGAVRDRLQDFQGAFSSHVIVDCHFVGDLSFDEDDLHRHGVARFEVLSEPA